MVYYGQNAYDDLNAIFYGLIMWTKHPLAPEHAMRYVDDIEEICNALDSKSYHQRTSYNTHKKYGDYVHLYKRNRNTRWYIIYNKDIFDNIFIERIITDALNI